MAKEGQDQSIRRVSRYLVHSFILAQHIPLILLLSSCCYCNGQVDNESELQYDLNNNYPNTRHVTVTLPEFGRVLGKRVGGVDFFGGLPYAAPPVGNLRWAPPEPPTPWAPAKLDATHYGPDCWQLVDPLANPGAEEENMSEDCLYLNVFTPAGAYKSMGSSSSLPVMVWLHGGAFQQGGARRPEYDGRRLAERGTLVVTLNYRLGALGFLVSSSDGLFGNFGLMDQRAALHWVKKNIVNFGGDPENVTLFGESAGGVMTVLHLMMEGNNRIQQTTKLSKTRRNHYEIIKKKRLFHKAIIQSDPLGLQFRSVVVADFIGEALKRSVDCRDLVCLRSERVEEIMRAQSSLMGVPRSVGDFFTWGPTQTQEWKLTLGATRSGGLSQSLSREHVLFRDLDSWKWHEAHRENAVAAVNVSQPLKNLNLIPDDIPIIIGANKHEGEMFVHGAFPITMSKAVYWMFVGALFRDSASRVLKHYRGYVDQIEKEAQELARKQIEEEENRQFYLENKDDLDREYQYLLEMNRSRVTAKMPTGTGYEALVETWSRGGSIVAVNGTTSTNTDNNRPWHKKVWPFFGNDGGDEIIETEKMREKRLLKEEKRKIREKERALKDAAKVSVDYRPVMSRIIDDYLFRCPAWHFAHKISRQRLERGQTNNVFVYQFSHSTHIPGFQECWGKSCHTAELPFVFQAMDVIRSNYSTLGPYAQKEAPQSPEYPYTDILAAYRDAMEAADRESDFDDTTSYNWGDNNTTSTNHHHHQHNKGFQRLLGHFFGDYFKEDADEEIASDMADRWVAFAKTGDPNYDSSKANWRPWRYLFDGEVEVEDGRLWEPEDIDAIFDLNRIDSEHYFENVYNDTAIEGYFWSDNPDEREYRRRALIALGMEVVEEDVFQTMLRRIKFEADNDNPFHNFLTRIASGGGGGGGGGGSSRKGGGKDKNLRRAIRQLQRIAQDMGFIGTGLIGEPRRRDVPVMDYWEDAFFPEILELKWPPEGRLVERDCTCDMWDRIRYRY